MALPKGRTNNPKGKPKGTQNKTTKEMMEMMNKIISGQLDNVNSALEQIRQESPAKYIDSISKLITYVLPKKTDISSSDGTMSPKIIVEVKEKSITKEIDKLKE